MIEIFYSDRGSLSKLCSTYGWKCFSLFEKPCIILNVTPNAFWRAQLDEGSKFICRWCYLRHRKLTGVWVEKLLLASRGYDIWFGPNRSILPTDQMPHRSWCRFVPTRPAAHIRASFLSLGLQDVCDGTIWQNAVCHVGVLALPTC